MNIAIIGAGNVGGALARAWSSKHTIYLGVKDPADPSKQELTKIPNTSLTTTAAAAGHAEVIVIAVHPPELQAVCTSLGDVSGKLIIDANNSMREKPGDFPDNSAAIASWTSGAKIVKCFNTAGANIIGHTDFNGLKADTYMAGDDPAAKEVVEDLAKDAGFARAVDCGKLANAGLLEKLAEVWVGLVINSDLGRDFSFKLLQRSE
jgi:predicted dinucleotide-binding enzyme